MPAPRSELSSSAVPVEPPARRRGPGWAMAFLGAVLILALLAGFVVYQTGTLPLRLFNAGNDRLEAWAGKFKDAFVAVTGMQPRVKINEQVVYEQASPILELAVLTRQTTVERDTESSWMGSTKRLRLRGLFRVKAGYDLRQPVTATIDSAHEDAVRVQMPTPRVLSVEMEKLDVLTLDNGLWNHVQPGELQDEVNFLTLEAHRKAQTGDIADEAQKLLVQQLQEKLGPGRKIEIVAAETRKSEVGTRK